MRAACGIFLFVCVVYVSAKSLPNEISVDVPETCTNVRFACQDLHVARKCKTVSACIEVWETIKVPGDNNEICDLCKQMVQQARDQLLSNETQEELKEVFEGSCNLLPIKAIAAECRKAVDEIVPEIIEMLASRMDPNQVCTVAGLCNNGLMKRLIKEQFVSAKPLMIAQDGKKCKRCVKGMVFVRKALKYIPESEFTSIVLRSCMGQFKGNFAQCDKFVKEAAPIVYNFLRVGNPSVFCSHMEHCPALDVPPPTYGDNMTCEFCEALIQYVRNVISSKSTETEFRTAFENMCNDLKEFSSECTNLVDEYFDQLYDFLVKNLEPESVCATLGLCDNSAVRHRIMMKLTSQLHVPILLSKAEQRDRMLKTNKPSELVKLTTSTRVQPIKLQKAEKILTGIEVEASKNTKDRRLIKATKLVKAEKITESNSVKQSEKIDAIPILVPNVVVKDDIECSLCKAAVMFLEQRLESNKSEERIRKALDEVCTIFPAELSSQCQDFINVYTDMFITLIIQEANPNMICAVLKVCSVQDSILPNDFNNEMKLTPKDKLVPCQLCRKVIQYIENYIGNNKTEAQIKAALEKVCSELPSSYSQECKDFVDEYADIIITLLTKEVAPTMVCSVLGLCSVEKEHYAILPNDFKTEIKLTPKVNFPRCDLCRQIIQYIENYIGNNKTEAQIKAALESVCSALPSSYRQECNDFVDEYAEIVITLLIKDVQPAMVCSVLGLCYVEKDFGVGYHLHEKVEGEVECTLCQYILHYLQNQLMQNSTEEQIKEAVEKICSDLPKSLADNCNAFVEEFGASLIVLLAQKLDPSVLCVNLKICPASSRQLTFQPIHAVALPQLDKCDTCEMVVNYVDKLLENDDVDTEITSLVEKICTILPTSVRDECTGILNIYGPYILQMIGQTADGKSVCTAIDLCAKTEKVQMLGTEKCTYGPSYWCQSKVHATACKAHEYCKRKVWKV